MSTSCQTLVDAFSECVLKSPCVQQDGLLPSECIRHRASDLPHECQMLRKALFDCKRGMLDMRKRFRGNNVAIPIDASRRPVEPISPTSGSTGST